MASSGVSLTVDASELHKLYADLRKAESSLSVELRRGIKAAATPMVTAVKTEAAWSKRIPAATKAKVSLGAKPTVTVMVDAKKAPEAAPLDNGGRTGTFRHPVFGNRETWVNQTARVFFEPATRKATPAVQALIEDVMDAVTAKAMGKS